MAGIKEIRNRIGSVTNTRKITSAMKMVSAAKLRKAQNAVTQMQPYAEKLKEILQNVSAGLDSAEDNVFAEKRDVKKILIVTIASSGGLCGGFNSYVVKEAIALASTKYKDLYEAGNVDFIAVGKKVSDMFKSRRIATVSTFHEVYDEFTYESIANFAQGLMDSFANKKYDSIEIVYNRFENAAMQVPTAEQYLPVEEKVEESGSTSNVDYIFEPSKEEIVMDLIPKSLKIQVYSALLNSVAGEHGARMTAMHKATDNATDLLKALKLEYNKARQASITNEILEIVSGAEALNG